MKRGELQQRLEAVNYYNHRMKNHEYMQQLANSHFDGCDFGNINGAKRELLSKQCRELIQHDRFINK